jgi:hypothetical protein
MKSFIIIENMYVTWQKGTVNIGAQSSASSPQISVDPQSAVPFVILLRTASRFRASLFGVPLNLRIFAARFRADYHFRPKLCHPRDASDDLSRACAAVHPRERARVPDGRDTRDRTAPARLFLHQPEWKQARAISRFEVRDLIENASRFRKARIV